MKNNNPIAIFIALLVMILVAIILLIVSAFTTMLFFKFLSWFGLNGIPIVVNL